jgi:hypothetical protein
MFDLPSLEGVEEVVISKEVVEGTARPLYIYARADRAGDASASQDVPRAACNADPPQNQRFLSGSKAMVRAIGAPRSIPPIIWPAPLGLRCGIFEGCDA